MTQNTDSEIPTEINEQELLDLLVDGELDDARRRRLLGSLDARPGGWRRCALAFLEAQNWGLACKSAAIEAPEDSQSAAPRDAASSRWTSPLSLLAIAASFLVAFTLGIVMRGFDISSKSTPRETIAQEPLIEEFAPREVIPPSDEWATVRSPAADDRDNLTLLVNDGSGPSRRVKVPLVDAQQIDEPFLSDDGAGLPLPILRKLEQMGHRVQRQRRYAPYDLEDGRKVIVPVDDVQITPVDRRTY